MNIGMLDVPENFLKLFSFLKICRFFCVCSNRAISIFLSSDHLAFFLFCYNKFNNLLTLFYETYKVTAVSRLASSRGSNIFIRTRVSFSLSPSLSFASFVTVSFLGSSLVPMAPSLLPPEQEFDFC